MSFGHADGRCRCGKRVSWTGEMSLFPREGLRCVQGQGGGRGEVAAADEDGPSAADVAKASAVTVPFGKFRGLSLGELVRRGRDGLLYLDWLVGLEDIRREDLRWAVGVMHAKHADEISRLVED